jgi:hypothetical protein
MDVRRVVRALLLALRLFKLTQNASAPIGPCEYARSLMDSRNTALNEVTKYA